MGKQLDQSYQIVSPDLTVKAMRDSGYKNTAYALAELIDNSIDAEAREIEVFACESKSDTGAATRARIDTIAVLDNGTGMDADLLRRALRFGDGKGPQPKRMGRFGIGLPNSSLSQCRKVEVWSWTSGPSNALYTYLELGEIQAGLSEVPEPTHVPVPDRWMILSEAVSDKGTLVVWTDLDRVQWFGAAATLRNTEELIGRIYRHWIASGQVSIRLIPVREDIILEGAREARPNDPLYLMAHSQTPIPFASSPMFQPYPLGEADPLGELKYPITVDGVTHEVTIRASIARPESRRWDIDGHPWPDDARPTVEPGHQKWGKHAARNVGISLVREGRELDLDSTWAIGYDPVERWWGVEVSFTSELDQIFGVTNNKQTATLFSKLARLDVEAETLDGETRKSMKDRMAAEGDPRLPLLELADYLQRTLKKIRRRVKEQREGSRSGKKRHGDDATEQASNVVDRRREEGHTGTTDKLGEEATPEERRENDFSNLTEQHQVEQEDAKSLVDEAIEHNWKVRWLSAHSDTPAFFSVDLMAGMLQVNFNMNHPVYDELMAVIDDVPDDADAQELRQRLRRAANTFKLLLFSWARYEDESASVSEKMRRQIAETRHDWGKFARDFLDAEAD
ncbi:ATP-binding protein [Mycobacteroides abscessus]|uniref:ATP-binding protein n=1 Tax=Mycobacteroides abscessus TaxID=36809 RepID=UPI000E67B81F|nr:ATP-binding protein [Mycobacteroides abscessus]RIU11518.1 ATP-binding protein [Mycobacteroides abscessus]